MSNTTKTLRIAALGAALATTFALQPAFAQDKSLPAPTGKTAPEHCPHMGEHGDHAAHMQQKLDDLGTKLHLKDSQQAAWKQYRAQLTELSAARHKDMEADGADKHDQVKNLSAPERLQKMADRMRAGADNLDKVAKQTATFYKTLTPEQQTIFDLYQRDLRPMHGHKQHMH